MAAATPTAYLWPFIATFSAARKNARVGIKAEGTGISTVPSYPQGGCPGAKQTNKQTNNHRLELKRKIKAILYFLIFVSIPETNEKPTNQTPVHV